MLYDPKWNENRENLNDFLAWVEQQPANKSYNWGSCEGCACGQYAKAIGREGWTEKCLLGTQFWRNANTLALGPPDSQRWTYRAISARWTFGALATRIREHLGQQDA